MDPDKKAQQETQHIHEAPQPERPLADTPEEEHAIGPIVGAVVVVTLFVLGGLYYFFWYATDEVQAPTPEEIQTAEDPTTEELLEQSSSDEIEDIEADLSVDEFSDLDAELEAIDTELGF